MTIQNARNGCEKKDDMLLLFEWVLKYFADTGNRSRGGG